MSVCREESDVHADDSFYQIAGAVSYGVMTTDVAEPQNQENCTLLHMTIITCTRVIIWMVIT